MLLSEFELIDRFFTGTGVARDDVILGIGDDAAQLRIPANQEVVVDLETLVGGSDFPEDTDSSALGHRTLANALSRLSARGAAPAWATLALTLPEVNEPWLQAFSTGFLRLAAQHKLQLIGGDTTRGPMSITLHVHGLIPRDECIPRTGAAPGDLVYVTGPLGDSALAVLALTEEVRLPKREKEYVLQKLNLPQPPVVQGPILRGIASAAVTLSAGVVQGLIDLLDASVGAMIHVERLPISPALESVFNLAGSWSVPLHAQEPCQLCFTIPPEKQPELEARSAAFHSICTWIGMIQQRPGVRCVLDDGTEYYSADP
jgi:thiamine-monophosphate kinase